MKATRFVATAATVIMSTKAAARLRNPYLRVAMKHATTGIHAWQTPMKQLLATGGSGYCQQQPP